MVNTTTTYNEAINNPDREIVGVVELELDKIHDVLATTDELGGSHATVPPSFHNIIGSPNVLYDGEGIYTKYAFLDNFPMDGSITLPSKTDSINNLYSGWISDWVYTTGIGNNFKSNFTYGEASYQADYITLETQIDVATTIKELTIYFKNGYPLNFTIYIGDEEINISEADHDTYFDSSNVFRYKFNQSITTSGLSIEINDWSEYNVRPSIGQIDFGLTEVYQNNEIIKMEINESVDMLRKETPINTISLDLISSKYFDILNEESYVKYLNSTAKIISYIGIRTKNGIEYVNTGKFYVADWRNNEDGSTTLIGNNLMGKVAGEQLTSNINMVGFEHIYINNVTHQRIDNLKNWFEATYPYQLDTEGITRTIVDSQQIPSDISLIDYLMTKAFSTNCFLIGTRDEKVKFQAINTTKQYEITQEQMESQKAKVYKKDKINKINYKSFNYGYGYTELAEDTPHETIQTVSFKLAKSVEYIKIASSDGYIDPHITTSGATVTNLTSNNTGSIYDQYFMYFMIFKVEGNVGDTVTIRIDDIVDRSKSWITTTDYSRTYDNVQNGEREISVEFAPPEGTVTSDTWINDNMNAFLQLQTDKNFEVDTYGNPAQEAGDCVGIETDYGEIKGIITDLTLLYDGGLRASIKGEVVNG